MQPDATRNTHELDVVYMQASEHVMTHCIKYTPPHMFVVAVP